MVSERIIRGNECTTTKSIDEPGPGGAHHNYEVNCVRDVGSPFVSVAFQKGAVKEKGVNGCQNEDLIAITIDRLRCFNAGPFSCRENAIAITKLEEAMLWLEKRTADRIARGVEGLGKL